MRSLCGYASLSLLLGCAQPAAGGAGAGGQSTIGGGASGGGHAGEGGAGGELALGGAGGTGGTGGDAPLECPENNGSGGAGECAEVAGVQPILATADTAFFLPLSCPLFGPGTDDIFMSIPNGVTGTVELALPVEGGMMCGETQVCLFLEVDLEGGLFDKYLMAKSGTLELGSTTPPYAIAGSLANVEFVEVIIAPALPPTIIDGGLCATLPNATFEVVGPAPGWSCDPGFYDETSQGSVSVFCDCACGAFDPDCSDSANLVLNCGAGEVCNTQGECVPG